MKSIVFTYPDFRELPKGLKQMLVFSETLFFEEVHTMPVVTGESHAGTRQWWRPQGQFATNNHAAFSA